MKTVEQTIHELNDKQMLQVVNEIKQWREKGVLAKGILTSIQSKYKDMIISTVESVFLYEIALRWKDTMNRN